MAASLDRFRSLLREKLPSLKADYRVESLGVFGSFLHGTERPDSDLDLLVSFTEKPSLFRLIDLENQLSDWLGVKVDLVLRSALKPRIGERVLKEVVPV